MDSDTAESLRGKVNLVFTSPPFPLASLKKCGNLVGDEYLKWLSSIVEGLVPLLSSDGSMVVEIGNAWDKGFLTMPTPPRGGD